MGTGGGDGEDDGGDGGDGGVLFSARCCGVALRCCKDDWIFVTGDVERSFHLSISKSFAASLHFDAHTNTVCTGCVATKVDSQLQLVRALGYLIFCACADIENPSHKHQLAPIHITLLLCTPCPNHHPHTFIRTYCT